MFKKNNKIALKILVTFIELRNFFQKELVKDVLAALKNHKSSSSKKGEKTVVSNAVENGRKERHTDFKYR